jgi:hypothetical protein
MRAKRGGRRALIGERVRRPGNNTSLAARCNSMASPTVLLPWGSDTSDSCVIIADTMSHPMGTNTHVSAMGTKKKAETTLIVVLRTLSTISYVVIRLSVRLACGELEAYTT